MSKLLSPLRYPGGKAKLYPVIKHIIENNTCNVDTYIEPFAGGAGIALNLLFDNVVQKIVINDYDKAIYSIWRAILTETNSFINLLKETPIDIQEWKNQKRIYSENNKRYSLEYGFSAFYLNRTNRSGIIKAGPIGGLTQEGKYKIDARYNKEELINRILDIVTQKDKIKLYNKECSSFIKNILPKYEKTGFIYFDPPYYDKGKELYKNFFESNDHVLLAQNIKNNVNCADCRQNQNGFVYFVFGCLRCQPQVIIISDDMCVRNGLKSKVSTLEELYGFFSKNTQKLHRKM